MDKKKICKNEDCRCEFKSKYPNTEYCSRTCRTAAYKKKRGLLRTGEKYNLSCGAVGALHELIVTIDLMKKGYEVFRAVSPACSCDLIALKNTSCLRIEVRTTYRNSDGTVTPHAYSKDIGRQDVFALVVDDAVKYSPPL